MSGVQEWCEWECREYAMSLGIVLLSLGVCSLFPSRVGLSIYQHPGSCFLGLLASVPDCSWPRNVSQSINVYIQDRPWKVGGERFKCPDGWQLIADGSRPVRSERRTGVV